MIKKVLEEREKTHGDYELVSITAQELKDAIHVSESYHMLQPAHKEALDLIATKIARIVNGDSNHKDHWVDIVGYAQLALDMIEDWD